MAETGVVEFRLRDYELKANYLVSQFERMWTRFQFLLGIETLLIGLYFAPLQSNRSLNVSIFAVLGLITAVVWYIIGSEDKYLVDLYRTQLRTAATAVVHALQLAEPYVFVGETDVEGVPRFRSIIDWRLSSISITTLVATFPLLVGALWISLLVLAR